MMYGVELTGVAPTMLKEQRSAMSSASHSANGGRNTMTALWSLDCEGRKVDPTFCAHEQPIFYYAKAYYEKWIPLPMLQNAFDSVSTALASAGFRWNAAIGPIGATVLTVKRLGWSFSSAHELCTDNGHAIGLLVDSPAFVKQQVTNAVRRMNDAEIDRGTPMLKSGGRGAVKSGIRKALRGKRNSKTHPLWLAKHKASLRSAVSNGQWPQCRLARAGLVKDDRCKLCDAAVGTLLHRHHCPCTSDARGSCALDKDCDKHLRAMSPGAKHLLTTRAMIASTDLTDYQPPAEETFTWIVEPSGGAIDSTNTIYCDGSMADGPSKDLSRVGFGFAAYDVNGELTASAYGTPPWWIDSAHGAETWALDQALRCSLPGARI